MPRPAAAGGGGEALFAVVGVMREEAPVGEARDEEADKAHNHEAERQIEHRRSVVEEGVPTTMPLNHVKILMSTSLARAGE